MKDWWLFRIQNSSIWPADWNVDIDSLNCDNLIWTRPQLENEKKEDRIIYNLRVIEQLGRISFWKFQLINQFKEVRQVRVREVIKLAV